MTEHRATLLAQAALARVRASWTYLASSLQHGPTTRGEHALSPAQLGQQHRQAREERADRHAILASGRIPTGPVSAPLRVAILDAQVLTLGTVCDAAWACSSALRCRLPVGSHGPGLTWQPYGDDQERFAGAAGYLAIALRHVTPRLGEQLADQLAQVDQLARNVAGVGQDRRPLKAECPACGRRSLEADVSSQDQAEWTVACRRDCRCQGVSCGCGLPLRYPRMRHIWPRKRFDELAVRLDRKAA